MLSEISRAQRDKYLQASSGDRRESCLLGDGCRDDNETREREWGECCSLGTESQVDGAGSSAELLYSRNNCAQDTHKDGALHHEETKYKEVGVCSLA